MTAEPTYQRSTTQAAQAQSNPYNGRWRWWYSSIADWMLRNPGGSMCDCAAELGRAEGTVYLIASSDMFKTYYAQRRQEWAEAHDQGLRTRLVEVAEKSLDSLIVQLEKKKDQVPLNLAVQIAESSLDRLGFAPKSQAQPTVTIQQNDNRTVVLQGVTPEALEEARAALRLAEQRRALSPPVAGAECEPRLAIEGEVGATTPADG